MIDYNRSQLQTFNSSMSTPGDNGPGPNDYQAWADRMQDYAGKVRAPELAPHAHRIADLAQQIVGIVDDARNDPPDFENASPTPPEWVNAYTKTLNESKGEFEALNNACPAGG